MATVEEWYESIPKIERSQPLIVKGGRIYTPDEVLAESRSCTALGRELGQTVERKDFTDIVDEYAVAVERLRERVAKLPEGMTIAGISGRAYTPSELLSQVEEGTDIGRALVDAEMSRMRSVLRK
jgi:hypothetical protein